MSYNFVPPVHGVAEGNVDRKISTLEYNNRAVYYCFNDTCTYEFGGPDLHPPPITIDDRPRPHKITRYTQDLLPYSISFDPENSVSTLTTPSGFLDILPSDDHITLHVMNKDGPFLGRVKIVYCCRKHDKKCYKNTRFYCSTCSDKNRKFYYCPGFSRINSEKNTCFLELQHYMSHFQLIVVFVSPPSFGLFCACFLPDIFITLCNIPYVCSD